MFTEQLHDLFDYVSNLPGFVCLVGDMNIHFDNPLQSLTKLCNLINLSKSLISPLTGVVISLTGLLFDLTMTSIKKYTVTDSLESYHYCTKSYFNVTVSKPSTLYRTIWNIAIIDRPSFIPEVSSASAFSSVEKANQFCDILRTVLDKHSPPSLRKALTHNSSPWLDSIREELFMAKRERRQAERKWRNTKLTIFKDLYRQAKQKV